MPNKHLCAHKFNPINLKQNKKLEQLRLLKYLFDCKIKQKILFN